MDVDLLKEIDFKLTEHDKKMCRIAADYKEATSKTQQDKIIMELNKMFNAKMKLLVERHKHFIRLLVTNEGKGKLSIQDRIRKTLKQRK